MIIKVIASGSKGNCTYLECEKVKILIDIGISYLQLKNQLEQINVNIKELNYVLITHVHKDHIKGLSTLLSKTNVKLITTENLYNELLSICKVSNYEIIKSKCVIDELFITFIPLSHDVLTYGFLIKYNEKELVYITDTGYINKKYFDLLSNKHIYIIEANYNEKRLMEGPYPFILKQRILSDIGHLSNNATGAFLSKVVGKNTKCVLLAHISEHNNDKSLAYAEVKTHLDDVGFDISKLFLADQYVSLDVVEV